MAKPELNSGYSLRFHSAADSPLALAAGKPVSLGQFKQNVEALLDLLSTPGDVLITCTGRYAFSVALLAAWLRKKTAILPNNHSEENLLKIRELSDIGFECDDQWAASLMDSPSSSHGEWHVDLAADFIAARLYTSGSTGTPKAIDKSLPSLLDEAIALRDRFDWPRGPILASVPPHHMYGLTFSVLLPWASQSSWVDDTPFFAEDVMQMAKQIHAGALISVPAQYKALLESGGDLKNTLCVSAASALPPETADKWKQAQGRDILEIYGSTETGVIGFREHSKSDNWQALPGVELSVVDGLLHIHSPFTGINWEKGFLSADKVKLLDNSSFQLLGRADSIIKLAGKRISLTGIEHALMEIPGIADAAVIAVDADREIRDKSIWAAVVPVNGQQLTSQDLRRILRKKLDSIEIPKRFVFTPDLPRTANGKLPRTRLLDLFSERNTADV